MQTLAIALGALVLYLVAYHTYGRFLARKIFKLDPEAEVPSHALEDGNDFVPTEKSVVFGHHFTSIAGTGPIVGPALAVIWGWVPALIWVLVGSIFIGAVHDFGALVVSLRNRGQTVGDLAGRVLSKRTRLLFLCILFLALTIVLAIFGLVIAAVFKQYPAAIFPCLVQIPLAVMIGVWLHRKGVHLLIPSLLALGIMYLTVAMGNDGILGDFNTALAAWPIMAWVVVLLVYSYVASVLPVWILLQPRDFINSLQLLSALGLIVLGLVAAAFLGLNHEEINQPLEIVAPAYRPNPAGAPLIFPFLFITIACGAISGFHCLVSSGTSSKQLRNESDAQLVGFGSMLTEGFLATLVILACVAGLGLGVVDDGKLVLGADAYNLRYESWMTAKGLGAKVGAFVDGSANFLKALGVRPDFAVAMMGVFVASFAATTLDTACRLQRYVTQELAATIFPKAGPARPGKSDHVLSWLANKHAATIFAVLVAGAVATLPKPGAEWTLATAGTGGLILWPLFGATNQLLAGLAFLVITFWLWRRNLPIWFIVPPTVLMLLLPGVAMSMELKKYIAAENWLLTGFAVGTLALQAWILLEAVLAWPKARGVLEPALAPLPASAENEGGRSC